MRYQKFVTIFHCLFSQIESFSMLWDQHDDKVFSQDDTRWIFCRSQTSFSVDYHRHVTSLAFVERFLWSDFYLGYWRFFQLYFCHVNIKIRFQSLLFFLWFCKNKAVNTFFLHFPFLCSFSELSLKYVFIIK